MNLLIIWLAKKISFFARLFNLGAGSTWPGHIALSLKENFIKEMLGANPRVKIVLIAGTNGKTTTTTLLRFILERNGFSVFQNESGANLLNGVASTLIQHSTLVGRLNYDVALFEIDENTLPLILEQIKPDAILILNLFRDQLDRYGEVNTIAKKWHSALRNLPKSTELFINGDDPELAYIGRQSGHDVHFFGLPVSQMSSKEIPHDVDFLYCPKCRTKLVFDKISYSHMGDFLCSGCGFRRPTIEFIADLPYPLFGSYNIYNINAASLIAYTFFGIRVDDIREVLREFRPVFGRQEKIEYRGKKAIILLSKNPTGFNQSIEAVDSQGKNYNVLLVLNDRIPDGRDVSWIWDVDIERLIKHARKIFISGDRCFDMGLRIMYSNSLEFQIEENLEQAINKAFDKTKEHEILFILPTYSAMLEVRKILKGRKIL